MFEQDWFAIEVMRNQNGTTNVCLVDTTIDEGGINDRIQSRQAELNELRDEMRERLDAQHIGGINFEIVEVTRNIKTDSTSQLTGAGAVPDIKETTNIDHWWLDHQDLVEPGTNDLYDFSKGACRCRAIGKAFHYKALAEAEDKGYNLHYELPGDEDKVAIFTGLGGGTGSGMFLDVARDIYEQNESTRVTLFATLPTRKEQVKERANAFAALSEIEYQSFAEEADVFDNVLLFPLQPLDPDIAVTDQQLLELDQAMTYALVGYYNAGMYDDAVNQAPSYAPFTIALPQVFQYDIEGIIEAKQNAIETINRKIDSLNAEREIYDQITAYVDEYYDSTADTELKRDDEDLLRRRIQYMRELVELPLFTELEFVNAVETGERLLDTVYDVDEDEESYDSKSIDVAFAESDLDDLLRHQLGFHFEFEYQDVDVGSDLNELEELDDESIERVILAEGARLKQKYETLRTIRRIPTTGTGDESTMKLLRYMLDPTVDVDESVRVQAVDKHLDEIRDQLRSIESEFDEVTERIQSELDVQQNFVESKVDTWKAAVADDLRQLAELEALDVEDDLAALENALGSFAREIEQGRTHPTGETVERALEDVRENVADIDAVDFDTRYDHIMEQVELAKQLRDDWDTYNESRKQSMLERLNPLQDTPDERSARKVLKSTIVGLSDDVFKTAHLGPNQTNLDLTVTYDPRRDDGLLQEVRRKRRELRDSVVDEYARLLEQIAEQEGSGSTDTTLVQKLDDRVDAVESPADLEREREDIYEYVSQTYKETASEELPELEARKAELRAEKEDLESTAQKYESVLDLYKEHRDLQEEFTTKHEAFNQDINQQSERFGTRAFAEYQPNQHFIHKYMPQDTRRAIEKESLASTDLFQYDWANNERSRIQDFSNEIVKRRASAPDYVGLRERQFGNRDYEFAGTSVHVAKVSEAIDPSSNDKALLWLDDLDVREGLEQNYYLNEQGEGKQMFAQWATQNGGPWDVALTFFIQGLGFLDNLRDVVETRGYRDGYDARNREIHDIVLHHAYCLDRGFYVRRREFLDPRDPSEREAFLNAGNEDIRHTLAPLLEKVPITDEMGVEEGPVTPVTYRHGESRLDDSGRTMVDDVDTGAATKDATTGDAGVVDASTDESSSDDSSEGFEEQDPPRDGVEEPTRTTAGGATEDSEVENED